MLRMALAIFVSILVVTLATPTYASNFLVTSAADSGSGTLRQAIFNANGTGGADTISFVFPGTAPVTIGILTALPAITDTVTIDGTTMPGVAMAGRPLVEVKGMVAGGTQGGFSGLDLQAPNCVVKGLIIANFYVGLNLGPPGGHTIQGNWIGLAANGTSAAGNNRGLQTEAASNNNLIGGTSTSQRNVISGNLTEGIAIGGLCTLPHCQENSSNDIIQGNFVGTDFTGNAAVPNAGNGIWLTDRSVNTLIGGPPPAGGSARNIISGNGQSGINVNGRGTITYNWIGRNVSGAALGNTFEGIWIFDNVGSTIAFNSIANNGAAGVQVAGHHIFIYSNSIFSNGRLGISLGGLPPYPNDTGDPDSGPNDLQNYPLVSTARAESAQLFVTGTLNSAPNANYYVSFFASSACDPSGNGEGETPIYAASVNTNGSGNATFSLTIPASVAPGQYITATARDAALNSSEFSPCRQVIGLGPPHVTSVIPTGGQWGTQVTINGDHLVSATSVGFSSGAVAASLFVVSDTQIITTVPTGASTGPIRVTNPYGSTLTDTFTVSNPVPEVSSVVPDSGLGAGGTNVTIHGTHFLTGATVFFGGVPATNVVLVNPFTITATTPPHQAGSVDVQVVNPDGGIGTLNFGFTYYCINLNVSITAPDRLFPGATGNVASVPDAGPGATYAWAISGGTINGGAGTSSITFSVGIVDANISVTVTRSDCSAASDHFVSVKVVHDDFNRDGKADIPLQDQANGNVAVWMMNGMNMFNGVLIGNAGPYRIRTTGDFDGDGKNDFAFQLPATGDIVMWLMNGANIASAPTVTNPGANWRLVGSGDTNGDRKDDLILQDVATGDVAVWMMNGASILNGNIVGTPGTSWSVVGAGDFNHDGKTDIALQQTGGTIAIWWIDVLTITGGGALGNPGASWLVKGVADVRGGGDGKILMRDSNTGDIAAWQMDGLLVSGFNIGNAGISNDLMGGADFNGDWTADILLRTSSGTLTVWLINNASVTNGLAIGSTGPDYVPIMK